MPTSKTVNLKLWRQNFERVAAVQGEDKARVLSMVISEREGVPFDMSGYTAEIYMHEANGRDVTLPAEIDGNIVTAVVPLITAAGDAAIQVILTKSTGEILKVAGLVLDVQPSELENAVDGSDEFNLLVGVTKQAEKAAGDALEAADIALEAADSVKARADSGEFNGDKGDTGPQGPQGVSGVYVGGGDMPEGYTVQVDPTGDMLCYTAGESDDRYANVLTGTASGSVAALEDVSPTGALRRAAVLGATTETGEGDKSPDNPYTLAGVQPTKVTVCGKNLLDSKAANGSSNGVTWTVQSDGCIKVTGTATGTATIDILPMRNTPYLWLSQGYTSSGAAHLPVCLIKEDGTKEYGSISNLGIRLGLTPVTGKVGILRVYKQYLSGDAVDETIYPYIGLEPDSPYAPYAGQTIDLPALAPLHGDGTVNDEYDAVSGVETRRWKQVVFDGTEAWAASATGTAGKYRASLSIADILPTATFSQVSSCRCSHYTTVSADNTYNLKVGISANHGTSHGIFVYDDAYDTQDMTDWKAYLAAQYAAGTPVTVVYQLDEPVITQHDPARILPPAPVCRVFADAGNAEVGYNRDVNIVIPKLEAALAELLGGGAQPMT